MSSKVTRFLIAAATSAYGDWLTTLAVVIVLYRISNGSVAAPAGYMVVRVLPRIIGPTLGGLLADRWSPQAVITVASLAQAALVAALIPAADHSSILAVYVFVGASQFLGALARPCFPALVPRITASKNYNRVNALDSALNSSSILVAPVLGSLLLLATTYKTLFILDAASFLVAALLVVTLGADRKSSESKEAATPAGSWSTVWRTPLLRSLAGAYLANSAAVTTLQGVLVVAAANNFGGDSKVGWLYAAVGAGGLVASVALTSKRWGHTPGRPAIVTASLIELLPLAIFTRATNFPIGLTLLFLSSVGACVYQVRGATAIQNIADPEQLARVNGTIFGLSYVGMMIGALEGVIIAPWLGWQAAVAITCALALLTVALTSFDVRATAQQPSSGRSETTG